MPYTMKKNKDGTYDVDSPNQKHASHTTKQKAEAQMRLLRAIEHNPEFVPTKQKKKKKAAKQPKQPRASRASY